MRLFATHIADEGNPAAPTSCWSIAAAPRLRGGSRRAAGIAMIQGWRTWLSYDPIPALLSAGDAALSYFVRRDLLEEDPATSARSGR